jgi:hypothetical protein
MDYILPVGAAAYALLALIKDWEAHKHSWRRIAVLGTILVIGIGSGVNTYSANSKHDADQIRINGLESAIRTANKSQEDNTRVFTAEITNLAKEVSDLQNKINSAGLRDEAEKLKVALESTSKALNPPKAVLALSFGLTPYATPLKRITLPVKDNIVHVEFSIVNQASVVAQNPIITIQICDACEFVREPNYLVKPAGQIATKRQISFDRLMPASFSQLMAADIKVPSMGSYMNFGMEYRCDNCEIQQITENTGIIALSR